MTVEELRTDRIFVVDDTGRTVMVISGQTDRLECADNEALHQAAINWNNLSQEDRITSRAVLSTSLGKWIDPVLAFIRAAEDDD